MQIISHPNYQCAYGLRFRRGIPAETRVRNGANSNAVGRFYCCGARVKGLNSKYDFVDISAVCAASLHVQWRQEACDLSPTWSAPRRRSQRVRGERAVHAGNPRGSPVTHVAVTPWGRLGFRLRITHSPATPGGCCRCCCCCCCCCCCATASQLRQDATCQRIASIDIQTLYSL